MRELDFDVFTAQDAGRAVYRSAFIYGVLIAYTKLYT